MFRCGVVQCFFCRDGHERPHERAHATHAEDKPAHAQLMSCRSCQFLAHVMPLMPQYISCHAAHAEIFAHIMPNTYHAAHAPHAAHVMPLMPKFMLAHVMPLMLLMLLMFAAHAPHAAHVCSCHASSCDFQTYHVSSCIFHTYHVSSCHVWLMPSSC